MIQVERDLAGGNTSPDDCDALHPMGTVPTRVDGELVVTEAATCCLCIATKYPDAALAPATGSDDWATTLRWLTLLTDIVQAPFLRWYLTEQYTGGAAGLEAVH